MFIPVNVVLCFKGGKFKNGELVGNKTKIIGDTNNIFEYVTISGSWNVNNIHTDMFVNLYNENALKNVFALSSSTVKNNIYIKRGVYKVSVENGNSCITIHDNTNVVLDGDIILKPNGLAVYNIIFIKGKNISLTGRGSIIGDKYTHLNKNGEWGMGVCIRESENVRISDITVKECWGDCICISSNSENVIVDNCTFIDGRRQGITVGAAKNVLISDCVISRVRGTAPQYAIDIEPDAGYVAGDIVIDNTLIYDCFGGIQIYGRAKNAWIGTVKIKKTTVVDTEAMYPLCLIRADNVHVEDCYIDSKDRTAVLFQEINKVYSHKNKIKKSIINQ